MTSSYLVYAVTAALLAVLFYKETLLLDEDNKEQSTWISQAGEEFQAQMDFDNFVTKVFLYCLTVISTAISVYCIWISITSVWL